MSASLSYVHVRKLVEISQAGEDSVASNFAHCASVCLRIGCEAASYFLLDQYSNGHVFIIIVVIVVVLISLLRR